MKLRTKSKKLLAMLLTFVMVLGMLPTVAFAADDREIITAVEATYDLSSAFYGSTVYPKSTDLIKITGDSITTGSPAHLSMLGLEKHNGTTWGDTPSGALQEGTYRFSARLRVDGDAGATHVINDSTTLKVNGYDWTPDSSSTSVYPSYSFRQFYGPEFTIVKPANVPLTVPESPVTHSGIFYAGTAITSFSVTSYVVGGVGSLSYAKKSGPSWINVSSDGTVSGTPITTGNNDPLVITVTDSATTPNSKDFTINLPITRIDPADRTVISDVEVTYDLSFAFYGSTDYPTIYLKLPITYTTKGSPAHLSTFGLEKQNGTTWGLPSGALQEGKYRYSAQLRVDDEAGATHVISSSPTLKVNGVEWIPDSNMPTVVEPTYSYRRFNSPEFTISEGTPTPIGSLTFDGTSMKPVAGGTPSVLTIPTDAPYKIKKVQNTFSSDPAEIDVQGWADTENMDDGFVTEFEAGKTYLYTLVLEPKEGQSFASNATITITGITWDEKNNGDPNVSSEIADSSSPYPGCLFISGYYTVPEEGASTPIGSLTFDGTSMKPVAGGTPSVLTIPTDAPYKIKKVQNTFSSDPAEIDVQGWADAENLGDGFVTSFEAGKTYLYTLVLEPKEGQSFASNATITITGITWDEKNNGDPNVSSEIADSSSPYPGCLFISAYYTVPEEGGTDTDEHTVTFKVVNGTWDGTDATDKTVTIENGATLSASDIPTGMTANSGFTGGAWDTTPNTTTPITGNVTYTYTFTAETGTIPDEFTVTFKVVNGTWDGTNNADITVAVDDGATLDTADIPTGMTANSGFTGGEWNTNPDTTTPITGNVTYTYTFTAETGTDTDEHTVTFKVVNGTWNGTDATDKTVTIEDGATLDTNDIPTGMTANSGFTGGAWDTTPNTTTPITGNVTYTYTFTAETGTPGGDENEDEDEDEDEDGGIRIINRGKPNKGIRIGEPYEYAKPLPDRYKDTAETNPNTGLSLSLAPLAFIAFLLKKKK